MEPTLTRAAAWLNTTFAGLDHSVAQFAHGLHEGALGGFLDWFMSFVTFFADAGWAFIALGLILMCFKKTRRLGMATLGGVIIGAIFTNLTIKNWVARPRPYADTASDFYAWWQTVGAHTESDLSFPSGHSTAACAAMTGLFFALGRKKHWRGWLFVVPLVIGFSRIYLMVHYTTDVLAGLCVGFLSGYLASKLVRVFVRWTRKNKPELALKLWGAGKARRRPVGSADTHC